MKVILLQDVRKVGRKYDVKDVSDGYALNFLIPRKLAESSTPSSEKRIGHMKSREDGERKVHEDLLMKNLKSLDGISIELAEPANDKGSLFKGVHQAELVAAVKNQTQLDLAPEHIVLEKPLKEVGEHTVIVKIQDKSVSFKVNIVAAK